MAQRVASLDPLNPWTLETLGDAYWWSGRVSDAEAAFRKAVTLMTPSTFVLHAMLSTLLLSANKPIVVTAFTHGLGAAGLVQSGKIYYRQSRLRGRRNALIARHFHQRQRIHGQ